MKQEAGRNFIHGVVDGSVRTIKSKYFLPAMLSASLAVGVTACDRNSNPTKILDSNTPIAGQVVPESRATMEKLKLSEKQYGDLKTQAVDKIDKQLEIFIAGKRAIDAIRGGKNYNYNDDYKKAYELDFYRAELSVDPILPVPILLDSNAMPVINPETGKAMLVNSLEATAYLKRTYEAVVSAKRGNFPIPTYLDNAHYMRNLNLMGVQVYATGRRSDPSDGPKAEDILIDPGTGKPIILFSPEANNALQEVFLTNTITGLAAQPPVMQK